MFSPIGVISIYAEGKGTAKSQAYVLDEALGKKPSGFFPKERSDVDESPRARQLIMIKMPKRLPKKIDFGWGDEVDLLKIYMKIPPDKKLELLRQFQELAAKYAPRSKIEKPRKTC